MSIPKLGLTLGAGQAVRAARRDTKFLKINSSWKSLVYSMLPNLKIQPEAKDPT